MYRKNFVFLSLFVVICLGVGLDYTLGHNNNSDQDKLVIEQLAKNSFTNIKLVDVNVNESCITNKKFDIKKSFTAEKDGKIINGKLCKNKQESKSIINIDSLKDKVDPRSLNF